MATFLQLAQRLASESGTVSGDTLPSTVVGQTGRLGKIVRWTNEAWRSIQNAHNAWRWMRGEFYGSTVASQVRYAGTAFNDVDTSAAITRFGEWVYTGDGYENRFSLYDPAIGVSDEGPLRYIDWDTFYTTRLRGVQTADKPSVFTIDPNSKLCLSPPPDKVYTVRGLYRKDTQEMTADGDVPEMPARFHDLIVDVGLMLLGTYDESMSQLPLWQLRKLSRFCELERDQLPIMQFSGPLA